MTANLSSITWDHPAILLLADIALKGLSILLLTFTATRLLRRRSASFRHLIWSLAFAALLILPALSLLIPQWRLPLLPAETTPALSPPSSNLPISPPPPLTQAPPPVVDPLLESLPLPTHQPSLPSPSPDQPPPPSPKPSLPIASYLLILTLTGATLLLAKLALGLALVARLRRNALPLTQDPWPTLSSHLSQSIGLPRPIPLLQSPNSTMPMATGLLHPAILLPSDAPHWPPDQRRMVLLHELAHIRRRDCLTSLLAHAALALHWFNPLAWLALRRLVIERELACDDVVLFAGSLPSRYAGCLLDIARSTHSTPLAAPAALPMARPSHLESRLLAILDAARPRTSATRRTITLCLTAMLLLILPLSALHITSATAAGDNNSALYKPIFPDSHPTSDITGLVTDESAHPLPNITVLALRDWDKNPEQQTTQTDPTGHFTFQNLTPGHWFFSVNDPRYGWEWDHEHGQSVPTNPENLPLTITLFKPQTLHGTVVNDDGKPVPGVRVVLVNQLLTGRTRPVNGHIDEDFLTTQTDATGHFTLDRLRPGIAGFVLEHPDYAKTLALVTLDGKSPTLTINKGLTLHGQVTRNGKPLPGVGVYAAMNEAQRPMVDWHGKTDADGRFIVPHIPPLPTSQRDRVECVGVSIQDNAWYSDYYGIYQINDHELSSVTLEARPAQGGKHPDPDYVDVGKPLVPQAGASPAAQRGVVNVHLPGPRGGDFAHIFLHSLTASDKPLDISQDANKDVVVLNGLPPDRYILSFNGTPARPPKTIKLTAGQTLDVILEPGPVKIRGVVRSGGKPVIGGSVSCFRSPRIPGAVFQVGAQVQADGSYTIDGLSEGGYQLIYQSPDSMPNLFTVQAREQVTPFDITLPTSRIDGKLIGRTPKPKNNDPDFPQIGSIRVTPRSNPLWPENNKGQIFVEAESNGTFTIQHLPPGQYTITGYNLSTTATIEREDSIVSASLRPPEHPGQIAGTLTGHLPPNFRDAWDQIQVTAFPLDQQGYNFDAWAYSTTVTSNTGDYRIRDLPPGTYGIRVSDGFGRRIPLIWLPSIEVRPDLSRDLPINIPPSRTILLSTDSPQTPCLGWRLRLPSGDWLDWASLDATRSAAQLTLPLGTYTLQADFGPQGLTTQSFTLSPGPTPQKITLSPNPK